MGAESHASWERYFASSEISSVTIHHRGRLHEIFKGPEQMRVIEKRNLEDNLGIRLRKVLEKHRPGIADDSRTISKPKGSGYDPIKSFPQYIAYSERVSLNVSGPDLGPNVLQFWTFAVEETAFRPTDLKGIPLCNAENANIPGDQNVTRIIDAKR